MSNELILKCNQRVDLDAQTWGDATYRDCGKPLFFANGADIFCEGCLRKELDHSKKVTARLFAVRRALEQ